MPRISGIDIPSEKKIKVSLRYIYGVGPTNALAILKEAGIDAQRRAKELTEEELAKIIGIIDRSYLVEGALRRRAPSISQPLSSRPMILASSSSVRSLARRWPSMPASRRMALLLVRRKGTVYVICSNPRHKQRQG